MGRPLKKDVNGVNVIGTFTGDAGLKVTGRFGGTTNTDYYIVKQRGAKTFVVTRDGSTYQLGVLVSSVTNNGDIAIIGYNSSGADATATPIAKITKRVATDFSGNRYNWYLTNYQDSTGDQLILTAL